MNENAPGALNTASRRRSNPGWSQITDASELRSSINGGPNENGVRLGREKRASTGTVERVLGPDNGARGLTLAASSVQCTSKSGCRAIDKAAAHGMVPLQ